jgi:NTP pyrophosphatase (non-canonical NTP hydrolase)
MAILSDDLLRQIIDFRGVRDWEQFHTPRNLSAALAVEAAELLDCFRWAKDEDLSDLIARERPHIEDEIADVAILLSYLCHDLQINVDSAVKHKLEENNQKYPLELVRGKATKYDRL